MMSRREQIESELAQLSAVYPEPPVMPEPVNEDEFRRWSASLTERIGRDLMAEIKEMHDRNWHRCSGFLEGQRCCVDLIVGDAEENVT